MKFIKEKQIALIIIFSLVLFCFTDSIGNYPILAYDTTNIEISTFQSDSKENWWWTDISLLTDSSSDESYGPSVVTDSLGNIHVVWYERISVPDADVHYRKSTDGGMSWTTKRLTWNTDGQWTPSIAIDSSDNIHVVWYDEAPGNFEIYYKRGIQ